MDYYLLMEFNFDLQTILSRAKGFENGIYLLSGSDAPPARAGPSAKNLMTVVDQMGRYSAVVSTIPPCNHVLSLGSITFTPHYVLRQINR